MQNRPGGHMRKAEFQFERQQGVCRRMRWVAICVKQGVLWRSMLLRRQEGSVR